ncbi:hypothetical protein MYOV003v1_p0181 [Vibrio phage 207E48.1]|nr:hypothetical protein MYOV003v1_p0181 [Vibrio phage 207E48.1]
MNRIIRAFKNLFNPLSGCILYINAMGDCIVWDTKQTRVRQAHGRHWQQLRGQVRMFNLDKGVNGWYFNKFFQQAVAGYDICPLQRTQVGINNFEGLEGGVVCLR